MKFLSLIFIQIFINFGETKGGKLSWEENQHRLEICGGADLKQNSEWYWSIRGLGGSASAYLVLDEKMKWRVKNVSDWECSSGSEHLKVPNHVLDYYSPRSALDRNTQNITKSIRLIEAHILKGCNRTIQSGFKFRYSLMLVGFKWVDLIRNTHVYPCIADQQKTVHEKEKLDSYTDKDKTIKVEFCEVTKNTNSQIDCFSDSPRWIGSPMMKKMNDRITIVAIFTSDPVDEKKLYTSYNMGWFYPDICSLAGVCSLKDADSLLTTTKAPETSTTKTMPLTSTESPSGTTSVSSTTFPKISESSKSDESSNYDLIAFYMFREVKAREDLNLEVSMNSSFCLEQIQMILVLLIWVVINKC